jgi:hypothetical protein
METLLHCLHVGNVTSWKGVYFKYLTRFSVMLFLVIYHYFCKSCESKRIQDSLKVCTERSNIAIPGSLCVGNIFFVDEEI